MLQAVTKDQAKQRALARQRIRGQGTLDAFLTLSQQQRLKVLHQRSKREEVGRLRTFHAGPCSHWNDQHPL